MPAQIETAQRASSRVDAGPPFSAAYHYLTLVGGFALFARTVFL
jgi:hypothetical protein